MWCATEILPPDLASLLTAQGTTGQLAMLVGPIGSGPQQFLPLGHALPYQVQFADSAEATTVANEIRVLTALDTDLDLLGGFLGFEQLERVLDHEGEVRALAERFVLHVAA